MGLEYKNLYERTRKFMVEEIERDIAKNALFLSDNLNPQGKIDYPNLIRNAAMSGSDVTLAEDIKNRLNP